MKTSTQIQNFILQNGQKLTNEEMRKRLNMNTKKSKQSFAGVLASMKRRKAIKANFLKSDNVINHISVAKQTTIRHKATSNLTNSGNIQKEINKRKTFYLNEFKKDLNLLVK